jgi:cytochrome c oxidase subunit 1/cytochrome c oxidase subunit I+III
MSPAVEQRLTYLWETPHTFWGWLSTVDHKKIGKRYLATSIAFLLAGGIEALIMRIQLARASQDLKPESVMPDVTQFAGNVLQDIVAFLNGLR